MSRHLCPGGVLIIEPLLTKEGFRTGAIHALSAEGGEVKIARHNVGKRRRDVAVLDFHFLISTRRGTRHFRDVHEMALFDRDKFLGILREAGLRSRFVKDGLTRHRGLYVAVKRS